MRAGVTLPLHNCTPPSPCTAEELVEEATQAAALREENSRLKRKYKSLYEELRRAKESLRHKAKVKGVTPESLLRSSRTSVPARQTTRKAWESRQRPASSSQRGGGRGRGRGGVKIAPRPATAPQPPPPTAALAALESKVEEAEAQVQRLAAENAELTRRLGATAATDSREAARSSALAAAEGESLRVALRDREAQASLLKGRLDSLQAYQAAERRVYDSTVEELQKTSAELRAARAQAANATGSLETLRARLARAEEAADECAALKSRVAALEEEKVALLESPFLRQGADVAALRKAAATARAGAEAAEGQLAYLRSTVAAQGAEVAELRNIKDTLAGTVERLESENAALRAAARAAATSTTALRDKLALYAGVLKYGENGGGPGSGEGALLGMDAAVIPPDELEAALAAVRRKLDGGALAAAADDDIPGLRKQVQTLQLQLLSSHRDLERAERMLGAQSALARDLSEEVDDLRSAKGSEVAKLRAALAAADARASKASTRVAILEAEVRTLRAGRRRGEGGEGDAALAAGTRLPPTTAAASDSSGLVESTPGAEAGWDDLDLPSLEPGENLLEVYIVDASLRAEALVAGAKRGGGGGPPPPPSSIASLVMLDFLDFETQASPLCGGVTPAYNFSAAFGVTADDWFLRHLASPGGVVGVEVAVATGADFAVIGHAPLPLFRLLTSRSGALRSAGLPVRSNGTGASAGAVIGSLQVEVRLALPLREAWGGLLASDPTAEAALASTMAAWSRAGAGGGGDVDASGVPRGQGGEEGGAPSLTTALAGAEGVAYLLVTVEEARRLVTPQGHPPSAYVQYALPCSVTGPWPVFTGVVRSSHAPVFAETSALPLAVSGATLTALRSQPLRLLLWDDAVRPAEAAGVAGADQEPLTAAEAGLLGTASVLLEPLAEGGAVRGWFDVTSPGAGGVTVGQVKVTVAWDARAPALLNAWHLRAAGQEAPTDALTVAPPPNAITAAQANGVFGRFSTHLRGVGVLWRQVAGRSAPITGVAFRPLTRLLTAHPAMYTAVVALRQGVALMEAGGGPLASTTPGLPTRPWREALLQAAEQAGRPGGALTAGEAADVLLGECDMPAGLATEPIGSMAAPAEGTPPGWAEEVTSGDTRRTLAGLFVACSEWREDVEVGGVPDATPGTLGAQELIQLLAPATPVAAGGEALLRRSLSLRGAKHASLGAWAKDLLRRFQVAADTAASDAVLDARRRGLSSPGGGEEEVLRALSREYVPVRGAVGVLQGLGIVVVPDAGMVFQAPAPEDEAEEVHAEERAGGGGTPPPDTAAGVAAGVFAAALDAAAGDRDEPNDEPEAEAVAPDVLPGEAPTEASPDQTAFAARAAAHSGAARGADTPTTAAHPPDQEADGVQTSLSPAGEHGGRKSPPPWLLPLPAPLHDLIWAVGKSLKELAGATTGRTAHPLSPLPLLQLFTALSEVVVAGGQQLRAITPSSLAAATGPAAEGGPTLQLQSFPDGLSPAQAGTCIAQLRTVLGVSPDGNPLQVTPRGPAPTSDAEDTPPLHFWALYEVARWSQGLDVRVTALPTADGEALPSAGALVALRAAALGSAVKRIIAFSAAAEASDGATPTGPVADAASLLTRWGATFAGVRAAAAAANAAPKAPRGTVHWRNLRDAFRTARVPVKQELRGRLGLWAARAEVAEALVGPCAHLSPATPPPAESPALAAQTTWSDSSTGSEQGCACAILGEVVQHVPYRALAALLDQVAQPLGFDPASHLPTLAAGLAGALLPLGRALLARRHTQAAGAATGVPLPSMPGVSPRQIAAADATAQPFGSGVLAVAVQLALARNGGSAADSTKPRSGLPELDLGHLFSTSGLARTLARLGLRLRSGGPVHARSVEFLLRCVAVACGHASATALPDDTSVPDSARGEGERAGTTVHLPLPLPATLLVAAEAAVRDIDHAETQESGEATTPGA